MGLIIEHLVIPFENDHRREYIRLAALQLGLPEEKIQLERILSKTLNIKNKEQFYYELVLEFWVPEDFDSGGSIVFKAKRAGKPIKPGNTANRPIVIGFGPAGMFAALELIEYGLKPLIFERGRRIEERVVDVERFMTQRELNPESNVQFGEGGAGSFSDGKLFSRGYKNTHYIQRVLETLIRFGAPEEIAYMGKPHLGTDIIRHIVMNIRNYILNHGGEIQFNSMMTDILISGGIAKGIEVNHTREYASSRIYLAPGHSSRETYELLLKRGVALEQRALSIGMRIEHPIELVNRMRYGNKYATHPSLGAASYSMHHTDRKTRRGVYTFCMCPGGEVINASSRQGMLVVNGMSYAARSSPYSNAALIVGCRAEDYPDHTALAGMYFQKEIERKAYIAGGGNWSVPGQNLFHFLGISQDEHLNANSCRQGAIAADMRDIYPSFVIEELQRAFTRWKEEEPLYVSEQAILLAAETRASSPVRIIRDEHFQSLTVRNLHPIGEGSGYTGGITSSAADALKAVECHFAG